MKAVEKILIYRLGSLGDSLIALPQFHLVRETYPKAKITFLTNIPVSGKAAPLLEVLQGMGICDETIAYPLGLRNPLRLFRLLRKLRRADYDVVIHMAAARGFWRSVRDGLFFRACCSGALVGIPFAGRDLECQYLGDGRYEWEADRLARRMRPIGIADLGEDRWWELRLSPDEMMRGQALLRGRNLERPLLAVSVGAKADVKDWTDRNWETLLEILSPLLSARFSLVFVGAKDEFERSENLRKRWRGNSANFCGATDVRSSAVLLGLAELFIGHDSGPMHLAATVGTPCVAIFSARNLPGQWFPRGERNRIFYNQTPCFGCNLDICLKYDKMCILGIRAEAVAQAALGLLGLAAPDAAIAGGQ